MKTPVVAGVIVLVVATTARAAPTRAECIAASEDAQLMKIKSQLRAAREKLVVCSDDACPKIVKQDCSNWLDEVDRAMPTIVFGAHDARGRDLTDVRVTMDGTPLADHLDGKAIAIDPGQHTFHFEMEGAPARDEQLVVREGDKNRNVTVTLGEPFAAHIEPPPVQKPTPPVWIEQPPPPKDERHGPSVATWIVGGLGLATLAAAGAVGTIALVRRSSLYDSCGSKGTCQPSDVDQVYTLYDLSYGGAAIGGALVVTSIVLFFATKVSSKPSNKFGGASAFITPFGVTGRF